VGLPALIAVLGCAQQREPGQRPRKPSVSTEGGSLAGLEPDSGTSRSRPEDQLGLGTSGRANSWLRVGVLVINASASVQTTPVQQPAEGKQQESSKRQAECGTQQVEGEANKPSPEGLQEASQHEHHRSKGVGAMRRAAPSGP
jgi:hypothetical protein